ncbi:MAG TPA: hypothetical protein VFJ59_09100, partial [Pseudolabrys sp.]|nr:hypothetical protein [Pseudolabrys sp.]
APDTWHRRQTLVCASQQERHRSFRRTLASSRPRFDAAGDLICRPLCDGAFIYDKAGTLRLWSGIG